MVVQLDVFSHAICWLGACVQSWLHLLPTPCVSLKATATANQGPQVPNAFPASTLPAPCPSSEQLASERIDAMLVPAGWVVQSRDALNLHAAQGVAVREFRLLPGHGVRQRRYVYAH